MQNKTYTVSYPWDENGYQPEVHYTMGVNENGFTMHIVAEERNPRRVETRHQHYVHLDSCVEWFVNFMPEKCDRYFNFEVNANGTMYVAFRKDRYDYKLLPVEDVESLGIRATIHEDSWEIDYTVPFALIEKYIPGYEYQEGMTIRANFYKCGDETEFPHYGIWNGPFTDEPDFHLPEYFADIVLE